MLNLTTRASKGGPLTWEEGDANWGDIQSAVNGLLVQSPGVGIASISQPTPSTLQITLTNSSTATFTLPVARFNYRGAWAGATDYAVNDTFQQGGALYAVLAAHTSAATFDAGANDGAGHDYYAVLIAAPTSFPLSGITGLGSGVATALGSGAGAAGGFALFSTLKTVATSGAYADLTGKPTLGAMAAKATVDLGADVSTTILPIANGGTGTATPGLVEGANIAITGTWPNQTIEASAGASAFSSLTDVAVSSPVVGQIPRFNGTAWVNSAAADLRCYTITNASGSVTVNRANGETQILQITGNVTSISFSGWGASGTFSKVTLILQYSGAYTVALPTARWAGGSVPSPTSVNGKEDWLTFMTVDGGSTLRAAAIGLNL